MKNKFTVQRGFPALIAALKSTAPKAAAVLMTGALLAACATDDTTADSADQGDAIRLTATVSGQHAAGITRSSTENGSLESTVNYSQFRGGQTVRLFIDGTRKVTGALTTTNTTATTYEDVSAPDATNANAERYFVLSSTYLWPTTDGTASFYGYWPVNNTLTPTNHTDTGTTTVTVPADQSAAAAPTFSTPSGVNADLLYAEQTSVKRSLNPVPLQFNHRMSRFSVTLVADGLLTDDQLKSSSAVTLRGMYCSGTLTKGSYTVSAQTSGTAQDISLKKAASGTSLANYCLLPPGQLLTGRTLTVSLTGNETMNIALPEYDLNGDGTAESISLSAGYDYRVTVRVSATALELQSFEIVPWDTRTKNNLENMTERPLTITNTSGGDNTITFKQYYTATTPVTYNVYNADGTFVRTGQTTVPGSGQSTTTIYLTRGQYVQFLGENNVYANTGTMNDQTNSYITGSAAHTASGNVMSLISSTDYPTLKTLPSSIHALFCHDANLKDASNLMLPATTLPVKAYQSLFWNCTGLEKGPKVLPATQLSTQCYISMFYNCKSLKEAPVLPATKMAEACYQAMFQQCTSLVNAPALPATTLATSCYYQMFLNCTSLQNAPELPAQTLTSWCYQHMFQGCTSLVTPPVIHARTMGADSSCQSMFEGCTSLEEAPDLPAMTLQYDCYWMMFRGCTSLKKAPKLPATTAPRCCYGYMFEGCTSLTEAPELPATTLVTECYQMMFQGCTNLVKGPSILPAKAVYSMCYQQMFRDCTKLTVAPEICATSASGGNSMSQMFYGCSSLKSIKCALTSATGSNVLTNWVNGVAATGTFYKNAAWEPGTGVSAIPAGWTVINY